MLCHSLTHFGYFSKKRPLYVLHKNIASFILLQAWKLLSLKLAKWDLKSGEARYFARAHHSRWPWNNGWLWTPISTLEKLEARYFLRTVDSSATIFWARATQPSHLSWKRGKLTHATSFGNHCWPELSFLTKTNFWLDCQMPELLWPDSHKAPDIQFSGKKILLQ